MTGVTGFYADLILWGERHASKGFTVGGSAWLWERYRSTLSILRPIVSFPQRSMRYRSVAQYRLILCIFLWIGHFDVETTLKKRIDIIAIKSRAARHLNPNLKSTVLSSRSNSPWQLLKVRLAVRREPLFPSLTNYLLRLSTVNAFECRSFLRLPVLLKPRPYCGLECSQPTCKQSRCWFLVFAVLR